MRGSGSEVAWREARRSRYFGELEKCLLILNQRLIMPFIKSSYRNDFYYGASKQLINRAKELRKQQTDAEKVLWNALRSHQFSGFKFRRQHPVKWFIADFYCHEVKLIIEVDGGIHATPDQSAYDVGRTAEIEEMGISLIRFTNEEILTNLEFVLKQIDKMIQLPTSPLRAERGQGGEVFCFKFKK